MAEPQVWRASRMRAAAGRASMTSRNGSRSRRAGLRLWTMLNAQAMIDGMIGGKDDVAFIEDDRRRFAAAHRAN
jgi:hypothetical protein